jgi:colanic acid biosynthesis glycosyl transferase WcaI
VRLVILTPHFEPDVAPTGAVITRIVAELARRGHRLDIVTSLPWYREHKVEEPFAGRLVRYEDTPWGQIARLNPFPAKDKRDVLRRGAAFAGFTALATHIGRRGDPVEGVLAVSPPLTLAVAGWLVSRKRGGPFVFNVQDVYPDVAVELDVLKDRRLIAAAHKLEHFCYERADAVTVLSEDIRANLSDKISDSHKVRVIPNFVDTEWISPAAKENAYRAEFGLSAKFVIMYAGNIGLSQSLDIVLDAAAALSYEEDVMFVLNGQGARRAELERRAAGLKNVMFVDMQPSQRLPEVLAAADLHLVPLRTGLARSSVPSKTYSILAAGRPLAASVDENSEVARILERSGAGVAVRPDDAEALAKALRRLIENRDQLEAMGRSGREFVESWASPEAVARSYEELFIELGSSLSHP